MNIQQCLSAFGTTRLCPIKSASGTKNRSFLNLIQLTISSDVNINFNEIQYGDGNYIDYIRSKLPLRHSLDLVASLYHLGRTDLDLILSTWKGQHCLEICTTYTQSLEKLLCFITHSIRLEVLRILYEIRNQIYCDRNLHARTCRKVLILVEVFYII